MAIIQQISLFNWEDDSEMQSAPDCDVDAGGGKDPAAEA